MKRTSPHFFLNFFWNFRYFFSVFFACPWNADVDLSGWLPRRPTVQVEDLGHVLDDLARRQRPRLCRSDIQNLWQGRKRQHRFQGKMSSQKIHENVFSQKKLKTIFHVSLTFFLLLGETILQLFNLQGHLCESSIAKMQSTCKRAVFKILPLERRSAKIYFLHAHCRFLTT